MSYQRKAQAAPATNLKDNERRLKVVVVGNGSVGKTNLLERLSNHRFNPARLATSRYDEAEMWVEVEGHIVRLNLWDTAGQEEFRSLSPLFYRDAHLCFLVYDVTNRKSFEGIRWWYDELQRQNPPAATLRPNKMPNAVLVGTKADLEHLREVDRDEGEQIAGEWEIAFVEHASVDSQQASPLAVLLGRLAVETLRLVYTDGAQRSRRLSTSVVPTKSSSPLRHHMPPPALIPTTMSSDDDDEGADEDAVHLPPQPPRNIFQLHERRSERVKYFEIDGKPYVDEDPDNACAC